MQIRLTDIGLDKVMAALAANSFGTAVVTCSTRRQVETVSIWTEDSPEGPGGYEVGLIRREMSNFARYEMVLETNRIEVPRLMTLLERIARENR